jgi:hypothetical protein
MYLSSIENRDRGRRDAFGVTSPTKGEDRARQGEVFDLYRLRAPSMGARPRIAFAIRMGIWAAFCGPLSGSLCERSPLGLGRRPRQERGLRPLRSVGALPTPPSARGTEPPGEGLPAGGLQALSESACQALHREALQGFSLGYFWASAVTDARPPGPPRSGPSGLFLSPHLPIRVEWG